MKVKYKVAIGDIHGCYNSLNHLIDKVDEKLRLDQVQLIFLGDYVDRGPDSLNTFLKVLMLKEEFPQTVILKGNHEDMLCYNESAWIFNGAKETLQSYGYNTDKWLWDDPAAERIFNNHMALMRDLPTFYEDDVHYFVHAGIVPDTPLSEQVVHHRLWIRHRFLMHTEKHPKYIVHGHTPLATAEPDIRDNRINLDTACVFGGKLTAAVFNLKDEKPIDIIQVPGYNAR